MLLTIIINTINNTLFIPIMISLVGSACLNNSDYYYYYNININYINNTITNPNKEIFLLLCEYMVLNKYSILLSLLVTFHPFVLFLLYFGWMCIKWIILIIIIALYLIIITQVKLMVYMVIFVINMSINYYYINI